MDFEALEEPKYTIQSYIDKHVPPEDLDLEESQRRQYAHYGAVTSVIFTRRDEAIGNSCSRKDLTIS